MNSRPTTPPHIAGGKPADEGDLILQRRYRLVRDRLPLEGVHLLDFGCGNGAQTLLFAPHAQRVTAVDIDPEHLESLRSRAQKLGLPVQTLLTDGTTLSLEDDSVDAAVSFEVLEHVRDEAAALRELHRVLRPGAGLAMSVPNRWWIFETHGARLPLLPWNRVPLFSWLPTRIHDRWAHARIYRRQEIIRKLEAAGFVVEESLHITAPMDVVPWTGLRRWLRRTFFRDDLSRCPMMAPAILVIARKP